MATPRDSALRNQSLTGTQKLRHAASDRNYLTTQWISPFSRRSILSAELLRGLCADPKQLAAFLHQQGLGAAVKSCMTHCSISLPACPRLHIVVSAGCCRGENVRSCEDWGCNNVWINGKTAVSWFHFIQFTQVAQVPVFMEMLWICCTCSRNLLTWVFTHRSVTSCKAYCMKNS